MSAKKRAPKIETYKHRIERGGRFYHSWRIPPYPFWTGMCDTKKEAIAAAKASIGRKGA